VGNGNIDVGNKTPTRKPGQPANEHLAGVTEPRIDQANPVQANPVKAEPPKICGAMSQQRGDNGNQSAPQKFVQLVGCRDAKARPDPWVRPAPAKR
jgi:hypothetical protein